MEAFDKDIQFLKDIWADDDQREITKRVIAIALSRANEDLTLGDVMALSDNLDDWLIEQEEDPRSEEKNMTI